MDENTSGERRSLSIEEAAGLLKQSREERQTPKEESAPAEIVEDQAETEDEAEVEAEPEAEEVEEVDDPEAEGDDEAEPEADGDTYEVGDVQFTLSELKEWQKNGLRQADYTKKTQELSEAKSAFEAERQTWEAEREQIVGHFQRQQKQLQDALATFVVDRAPKPKRADFGTTDQYLQAMDAWEAGQEKKAKAKQAYQALQAQQTQEVLKRETAQLLRYFPDWRKPEVYESEARKIANVATQFGFSEEEVRGIKDHRMVRVLKELESLKGEAEVRKKSAETAVTKVKAAKRLAPGVKSGTENQAVKEVRKTRERLKKTGSVQDALALLKAKRSQA